MAWRQTPAGVTYTKQQIEYQQFPEEFFSGADVIIYFGDVFLADLSGLQFVLIEQVRPIYGYASYTWDVVKRGTRLVRGSFRMAFREAGYLYRVLDHLGQLGGKAAPTLAHLLGGETSVPQWHADAMQTIEELLGGDLGPPRRGRYIVLAPDEYDTVGVSVAGIWSRDLAERLGLSAEWNALGKSVIIGGKEFVPYKIENGRAYVYIRDVAEALGYEVKWDNATRIITIYSIDSYEPVAEVPPGEYIIAEDLNDVSLMWSQDLARILGTTAIWDNAKRGVIIGGIMFSPHKVENGKSYVHVRQVAEALGYHVGWDSSTKVITIQRPVKRLVTAIKPGEYELRTLRSGRATMWSRALGQRMGMSVDWDPIRRTALIGGHEFTPSSVEDGKSYVRVRDVAMAFGYGIFWNSQTRYIIMTAPGSILITPNSFAIIPAEGRTVMPAQALCAYIGADPSDPAQFKIEQDGVYYFGRRFDRVDGVIPGQTAAYIREVLEAFNFTVEWVKGPDCVVATPPGAPSGPIKPGSARFLQDMSAYESEVWGDAFVPEREKYRHHVPYFYSGTYMEPLRKHGFDIYIVYGPLPYHVKERLNVLPDVISYETTVKAIRNVQLLSCSQVLDPSGRPVEEVYEFIARDMD